MNIIYKYWKRLLACLCLIIMAAGIGIYGYYCDGMSNSELEMEKAAELYEEVIMPTMLNDNVKTTISIDDDSMKVELGYAISGINSLVSFYKEVKGDSTISYELWNDVEKYYVRIVTDGVDNLYSIDITDETRDSLNNYVYMHYITVASYLGVASKERIVSFEPAGENVYYAMSMLGESVYKMLFTIADGNLSNIHMISSDAGNTVDINLDKFNIAEQSVYEKYTVNRVTVDDIIEKLDALVAE